MGYRKLVIAIIHRHIRFIGELLAEVKEPKTIDELLEVATKKYKFDWTQDQQVRDEAISATGRD